MDSPANPTERDDAALLRRAGLRATASRSAVLAALRGLGRPVTHAEVVDALAGGGWDRATLDRNLQDLTEAGLVARSDLGDHLWRFELAAPTAHVGAHPHFVCTGCGDVACLPEVLLPAAALDVPQAVRDGRVEIQVRGLCDRCDTDAGSAA